jgi:2-keto-4-pentenoate hydratase
VTGYDPAAAALVLLANRRAGKPAGPLPSGIAPKSLADGIAVQVALAGLLGALPPAGFKIGATAARMQAYLGLPGPAAGFMPAAGLHPTGTALPWASAYPIGVECEIGVRLGHSLPPGKCDRSVAEAAVADVFAAIEVVANRYGPPPAGDLAALGTPTLIADQVYHTAAIIGAPAANWRALDLAASRGELEVDGRVLGEGVGAELLGHPMQALAWLAGSDEVRAFGGLRAGQIVMLGSVMPPIWLGRPATVRVTFDGLGSTTVTFD